MSIRDEAEVMNAAFVRALEAFLKGGGMGSPECAIEMAAITSSLVHSLAATIIAASEGCDARFNAALSMAIMSLARVAREMDAQAHNDARKLCEREREGATLQ